MDLPVPEELPSSHEPDDDDTINVDAGPPYPGNAV